MSIKIYTRKYCSYCVRAKRLLEELGVVYQEIPVDQDPELLQEMKTASGQHTVPQIWIGQTHVGGCDELMQLHFSNQLRALLANAG